MWIFQNFLGADEVDLHLVWLFDGDGHPIVEGYLELKEVLFEFSDGPVEGPAVMNLLVDCLKRPW